MANVQLLTKNIRALGELSDEEMAVALKLGAKLLPELAKLSDANDSVGMSDSVKLTIDPKGQNQ